MQKARLIFKNGGRRKQQPDRIVNNFLRWFITEPRTYIKERRKRRQWMRRWIRKRDSKGVYYSIINYLKLTDKENLEKTLAAIPILLYSV